MMRIIDGVSKPNTRYLNYKELRVFNLKSYRYSTEKKKLVRVTQKKGKF